MCSIASVPEPAASTPHEAIGRTIIIGTILFLSEISALTVDSSLWDFQIQGTYRMVRGRKGRHLVPVPRVFEEEELNLLRYLRCEQSEHSVRCDVPSLRQTCSGDRKEPHSCTSFVNMLHGPRFSTLRKRPKTDSSSYVIPISACEHPSRQEPQFMNRSNKIQPTSSACTYVSVIGSSSAVGTASRNLEGRRSFINPK